MTRTVALLVAAIVALPSAADAQQPQRPAAAPASAEHLLFVSNEGSRSLSIVDPVKRRVIATIPLDGRARGVQVSPDGRRAYVALSDDQPNAESGLDAIVEVDVARRVVVRRNSSGTDPEQFAVSPDGRWLYASNEDAGTASISDLRSGRVVATLVVGIEPEGVAVSPDGRWVYVTAETSNSVSVIDTRTNEVAANFLVDVRPRAATFSPDGRRAYVTAEIGGTVAVIDVAKHEVLETVALGDGSTKPVGVAVSPDGRTVYVANGAAGCVSVMDARTHRVRRCIPVGRRPWGVTVSPDGRWVYTADGLSDAVSVIDARTSRVAGTIAVGSRPWGVAVARVAPPVPPARAR